MFDLFKFVPKPLREAARERYSQQPPASQPQTQDVQEYVYQRAQQTAPKVGDRLYATFDPATGLASSTTQKTDLPLYFDPIKRELTADRTAIPALYGMVGVDRLSIRTPVGRPATGTAGVAEAFKVSRDLELAAAGRIGPAAPGVWQQAQPGMERSLRRRPMTAIELQQHNTYIKQLAARQQTLDHELSALTLQSAMYSGDPHSPEWVAIEQRRTSLIEEIESIRRRATQEPELVLVQGPSEPLPIELRAPGARGTPFLKNLEYGFNWEVRAVHSALGESKEASPFVDLAGRAVALLVGLVGTGGSFITSPPGGRIRFTGQTGSISIDPNLDVQDSISHLVRIGWDRDEAERIVSDIQRGRVMWEDRQAWLVLDTHARLEPITTKIQLLDEAWRRSLEEHPITPRPVRGISPVLRQQAIERNLAMGEDFARNVEQGQALTEEALSLRLIDISGERIKPLLERARQHWGAAYDALEQRTDIPTYTFRYTWILDDKGEELESQARQAVIDAAMQLGRWPEPWEIEEITNRFTNPLAELGGDIFLDPLNLIPAVLMERLIVKPIAGLFRGAKRLAVSTKPGAWVARTLASESIHSSSGRMGHIVAELLRASGRATGSSEGAVAGLEMGLRALSDPASVPLGELGRAGIREYHLDLLSRVVTSLQRGAKELTQEQAIKKLSELIRGTLDEVGSIHTQRLIDAGEEATAAASRASSMSSNLDEFLRYVPRKVQDAILDNQRLWENGPIDEGFLAQFAKLVGANVTKDGKVVHRSWRDALTTLSRWHNKIWSVHVKLLLTARPGFTAWNYVDSMTRALLWGANPFDNVADIYRQQTEMGAFLDELIDSFAHGEGLLDPQLTRRILSGEISVRQGMASVFAEGWKLGTDPFDRWVKGWATVNSFLEATWRTRLYNTHFNRQWAVARTLIEQALPDILVRHGLTDERLVAAIRELMVEHQYSGSGLLQAIEELVRTRKGANGILTPPGILDQLAAVAGRAQATDLAGEISRSLRQLVAEGNYTDEAIDALMDEIKVRYQARAAAQREAAAPLRGSVGDVNPDAKLETPEVPSPEEMLAKADAPVSKPIRRAFKSGPHDNVAEFVSQDQADLERVGRIARRLAGDTYQSAFTRPKTSAQRELRELVDRLSQRLGLTESEVKSLGLRVADDVSAQMKGARGETRVLIDSVGIPSPAGQADEATRRLALQEEYDELNKRLLDEATPREELPAIRSRMGEIDEVLRPSKVKERAAAEIDEALGPALSEEVSLVDTALDAQVRKEILTPEQAQSLRQRAREAGALWASARREFSEMAGQARATLQAHLDNVAKGVEELNPDVSRAVGYMTEAEDALERHLSGAHRNFTLNGPNGPLRAAQGADPVFVGRRWDEWFTMRANAWNSGANRLQEVMELFRKGDYTELARRFAAGEFPTWRNLWEDSGWVFDVAEDGTLLSIKPPLPARVTYTQANRPHILQDFLRYNGAVDNDIRAFNIAFMDRPAISSEAMEKYLGVQDELARGAQPVAEAAVDTAQEVAQAIDARKAPNPDVDAAWQAVVKHPELRLNYPKAREGFDVFEEWANKRIAELRRTGTPDAVEKARILEAQLVQARQMYRALLIERGLLDIVEMPLPGINQIDEGTRTYMNLAGDATKGEEVLDDVIEQWRSFAKEQARAGTWRVGRFDKVQGEAAVNAVGEIGKLVDQALEVAQRGSDHFAGLKGWDAAGRFLGHRFDGALPITNKVMIDYSTQSKFLRTMRTFFPFIRFQLRSVPMWVETMVIHPELAAFYMKYLQASRRYAYQRGAIDLRGNPRTSLSGYVPVPGTDIWVNPMAPISLRYVFPKEDYYQQDETASETSMLASVVNYVAETGQLMGVGMHPWLGIVLSAFGQLDPGRVIQYSIFPQTKLLPPSWTRSLVSALRARRFGPAGEIVGTMLDPELVFEDYLIERRVLVNALNAMSNPDMSDQAKRDLAGLVGVALTVDERINPDGTPKNQEAYDMWARARDELEGEDYANNVIGYFTGLYGKAFTDADADLERMRREINSLRMTLNDEVGVEVLGLDMDAERRWQYYLDKKYDTPEGYLYGLRNIIGWAQVPTGRIDPKTGKEIYEQLYGEDRLKLIANRIRADQKIDTFYEGMANARTALENGLSTLPVGASGALKAKYYEEYSQAVTKSLDEETRMLLLRTNNYIGYKPEALVYQQAREMWFEAIRNLAPVWKVEQGEKYTEWRERYEAWLQTLPALAPLLVRDLEEFFLNMEWADPTNKPENLMTLLAQETTPEGYEAWRKENDSIYQAIDFVHGKFYLDEYYKRVDGLSNEERQLAEREFYRQWDNQGTPTEENFVEWIMQEYPDKFTEDQILMALRGRPVNTPELRSLEGTGPLRPLLNEAFEILSLVAPGVEYGKFLDAYRAAGGDEGDLDVIYNPLTGQATKEIDFPSDKGREWLEAVLERMKRAASILGLDNLSDAQLKERADARDLNEQFRAGVTQALGEDFWTLQGYYYGLSLSEQAEFRKNQPDQYKRIEAYRKMRDAFAEQNPLWAKYYRESDKKATGGGGGGGRGRGAGGAAPRRAIPPGGFVAPGMRSTLDARYLTPYNIGRAGTTKNLAWPRWLLERLGPVMAEEVAKLIDDGEVLPPQVEEYLKNLAARNNDARLTIEPTLELNEKAKALGGGGGGPIMVR